MPWLRGAMDSLFETRQAFYTQIGMFMEDATVVALKLGGGQADPDPAEILELENAVQEIVELMRAARSNAE